MERKQITDEGLNLIFLAPKVDMKDIVVEAYKDKLIVDIPATDFTYRTRKVSEFAETLNPEKAKAKLDKGVLTISIPYNEREKPKKIAIT